METIIEPGLSVAQLAKRLNISYQRALRWAANNGYRLEQKNSMSRLPKTADGIPKGMFIGDLAQLLRASNYLARKWSLIMGYEPSDGRKYFSGRHRASLEVVEKTIDFLKRNSNLTLREVGDKLGVTREYARQLYEKYGIPRISHRGGRKFIPSVEAVRKLAEQQLSAKGIAEKLGCSPKTIYTYCSRNKIKLRGLTENQKEIRSGVKTCSHCKRTKNLSAFPKSNLAYCKDCIAEMQRRRRILEKEKIKAAVIKSLTYLR